MSPKCKEKKNNLRWYSSHAVRQNVSNCASAFRCMDVFQVPEEHTGAVVDLLSRRKGEMLNMSPVEGSGDTQMTDIEYIVPTRGMIGLRNSMLTATRGTAVMDTVFNSYKPYAGVSYGRLLQWVTVNCIPRVVHWLFFCLSDAAHVLGGSRTWSGFIEVTYARHVWREFNSAAVCSRVLAPSSSSVVSCRGTCDMECCNAIIMCMGCVCLNISMNCRGARSKPTARWGRELPPTIAGE